MTSPTTSHKWAADTVTAIALTLFALAGGAVWFFEVSFKLAGEATRDDYETAAAEMLVLAGILLLLGLVTMVGLRSSRWVYAVLVAVVVALLGVAGLAWSRASSAPEDDFGATWSPLDVLYLVSILPTSWPLVVLLLVAAWQRLRARSSPAPRSPQAP